jgi:hypothetical protein
MGYYLTSFIIPLLQLPRNFLTTESTFHMLVHNQTLTKLNLEDNDFNDASGQALSDAIRGNTTLEELNLKFNHYTASTLSLVEKALTVNRTLKSLSLLFNNWEEELDLDAYSKRMNHRPTCKVELLQNDPDA